MSTSVAFLSACVCPCIQALPCFISSLLCDADMESGETAAAAMSSSTRMWYRFIPGKSGAENQRSGSGITREGQWIERTGCYCGGARVDRWSEVEFSSSLV